MDANGLFLFCILCVAGTLEPAYGASISSFNTTTFGRPGLFADAAQRFRELIHGERSHATHPIHDLIHGAGNSLQPLENSPGTESSVHSHHSSLAETTKRLRDAFNNLVKNTANHFTNIAPAGGAHQTRILDTPQKSTSTSHEFPPLGDLSAITTQGGASGNPLLGGLGTNPPIGGLGTKTPLGDVGGTTLLGGHGQSEQGGKPLGILGLSSLVEEAKTHGQIGKTAPGIQSNTGTGGLTPRLTLISDTIRNLVGHASASTTGATQTPITHGVIGRGVEALRSFVRHVLGKA